MFKNLILFVLVLVLLPTVFALDIGYVVSNPGVLSGNDVSLRNILVGDGHMVSFLDDVSFNAGNYDLIIVSGGVSNIEGVFDNTKYRTLFLGNSAAKKAGLSSGSTTSSRRRSEIRDITHYVTEEYSLGDLDLYTSTGSMSYLNGCKASGSYSLVSHDSDNSKIVVFGVDHNSMLIDSGCTDRDKRVYESNVFFGLNEVSKWNSEAENLFKRSIVWLITSGLVDEDGDGYDSLESGGDDCDDNDADVNPGSSDINKNCVNDAPEIISVNPANNFNILENVGRVFLVSVRDEESDLDYIWKVNNRIVGSESSYEFNRNMGVYNVEVIVSDGSLSDSNSWTVNVRDSSYFSCSDLGGIVCSVNQVCDSELYEVSDTNSCCSSSCSVKPPEFSDASNICESKNSKIEIDLDNFDENLDYEVGQEIDFDIKIGNEFDDKMEVEVEGYFYDVTDEKVIESFEDKFDINKDGSELSSFDFKIPYDLEDDHDYRIFVYVENDNNLCNQKDVAVDVIRGDLDVFIDKLRIDQDSFVCGDSVDVRVDVKNYGDDDEDVYVSVVNSDLSINERSESFEIEKYGDDDDERENFLIWIPEDAENGRYNLKVEVHTDGDNFVVEREIVLESCSSQGVEGSEVGGGVRLGGSELGSGGSGDEGVELGGDGLIGGVIGEVGVVEGVDKVEVFVGFVLLFIAIGSLGAVWWFFW